MKNQSQQNQKHGYSTLRIPEAPGLQGKSVQAMHRRTIQSSLYRVAQSTMVLMTLPYKLVANRFWLLFYQFVLFFSLRHYPNPLHNDSKDTTEVSHKYSTRALCVFKDYLLD